MGCSLPVALARAVQVVAGSRHTGYWVKPHCFLGFCLTKDKIP